MSNVARVAGQAANTLSKPLNVEDVFSTYLYTGTGAAQTITNGIDLDGEGGLVWSKNRDTAYAPMLFDTERGLPSLIYSSANGTADTTSGLATGTVTSFNSNGFSLGSEPSANGSGQAIASWTFRKAPKFFDVVTYTGDGTNGRQIPHNLGSNIGMVICKGVDVSSTWAVKHKDRPSDEGQLNSTNAFAGYGNFPTSFAGFTDSYFTVDAGGSTNANGYNYVAYLFAHNDGDGGFGPNGDADIIKCGTCSGESGSNRDIDLGFEPQFIITKAVSQTGDWRLLDTMRGWIANPKLDTTYLNNRLEPNTSDAESGDDTVYIKSNGFYVNGLPGSGDYIYIAIRRGPMAVPEDATDVFAIDQQNSSEPYLTSGFPVDFAFQKRKDNSSNWMTGSRLQNQKQMNLDLNSPENNETAHEWDYMDGFRSSGYSSDWFGWMWRRAPGFFDCLSYTGNSTTGHLINHNLGVAPEMIWVKSRDLSQDWAVWHKDDDTGLIYINRNDGRTGNNWIGETTATTFEHLRTGGFSNYTGFNYLAMLFATLDGISKVGSYTATGSDQNIDCGFSSGARFVLIKGTSLASAWVVIDTERGLVTGNDPWLRLDNNTAENSSYDMLDPYSSGFTVTGSNGNVNSSGETYIFYAIA